MRKRDLQILPGTYGSLLNTTKPPPSIASAMANGNLTQAPNGTYYSGLTGVNLGRDRTLTQALSIALLCGVILVLGLRIWQLLTAHQRKIFCLTASKSQQNYWSYDRNAWWPWLKKHVIYAPLGKVRHNREWQLSKAHNYGTTPGRLHTAILLIYIISNLVFCLYLEYDHEIPKILAELRGRSGLLATWNMMALLLLAARNNPLIWALEISFDTFNLFHRWLGRLIIIEALAHVLAWYGAISIAKPPGGSNQAVADKPFLQYGVLAMTAFGIIFFQSFSAIRHAFYETFLHLHQFLAFIAILGIYLHLDVADLPALPYIRIVCIIWAIERMWRILRLVYLNFTFKNGVTTVVIEALPGQAVRLTFQLPRHIEVRPGSHSYVYIPRFSWHMSHPFSVAWVPSDSEPPTGMEGARYSVQPGNNIELATLPLSRPSSPDSLESQSLAKEPRWMKRAKPPTSLSFVVAARSGFTRTLYDAAHARPYGTLECSGLIEGPYAGHDSLGSYGTVIMFAGGAGITHHLIQARFLLASAAANTVATRKIILVWTVRDAEQFAWVASWMNEILAVPGRKEMLKILLYVTRGKNADYRHKNGRLISYAGRCSPGDILDRELRDRVGATMVSVCGPGAFADEVRKAVRERVDWGCLDMDEESFTW
jgi:predicted ferric reductase